MTTIITKRMKVTEMENDEEIEEETASSSSYSLETLPDVVLHHLVPFLKWTSRRSLSQVNNRFRFHYLSLLKEAQSLSIKGQVSVGVGDDKNSERSVSSFLSEFYTIRCEMDDDWVVEWTLKLESGIRTVVHTHYDGDVVRESTKSVALSSRDYLEKKVEWLLKKFQFKKIHLGVPGLAHLFDSYDHKVKDIGVSIDVEYLKLAERLSPKKLTLFQSFHQFPSKKGALNLKNFPQLVELRLYGVPLDMDQFVESRISKVHADTLKSSIKLRHARKMIQNWKSGQVPYKDILISCEFSSKIPIHVPYNIWSELRENDMDEYYDNVESNHQEIGSFLYSSKSFQFILWDGQKEPNMRFSLY